MSQRKSWWICVLPLLVIWVVTNFFMTDRVESDLTARTAAAITALPVLDKSSVTVAGRDATLAGAAFSVQSNSDAVNAADNTRGVRLVNDTIAAVAAAKPYIFNAKRDGDKLVLSGNVPLPATRATIIEAAKSSAPNATIVDQMVYAQGAPDGFEAIATYGLAEAGKLSNGALSLSDKAYSIAGQASTAAIYQSALAATRHLPAGATIANVDIRSDAVSPYVFNATKGDGAIKLTGYYPDEQTHKDLLAAVSQRFPNYKLSDELTLGKGAPKDFAGAASAMLLELSGLFSGVGKISDMNVSITGEALSAKAAADFSGELSAAVPNGYKSSATIGIAAQVAANAKAAEDARLAAAAAAKAAEDARQAAAAKAIEDARLAATAKAAEDARLAATAKATDEKSQAAVACKAQFADILAKTKILFDTGKASIQKNSDAVLDNLTATATRCPDAHIEISGHTDSVGNDGTNMQLSRRRAEAVSGYLVKAGIASDRLTAVGYGETRPVASNDTEEGRARNRRIEFDVK